MITSTSYIKSKVSKTSALWISLLFMMFLAVVILFVFEIPQNIQKGLNGHVVHKELVKTRQSLLRMKGFISPYNINKTKFTSTSVIEELGKHTNACIQDFETAAVYSSILGYTITDFKLAYNNWVIAEKLYLNQLLHSRQKTFSASDEKNLIVKGSENNALFLNTMQLLLDTEKPISKDLELAQQSFKILQGAALFIIICFFTVVILYQRSSTRQHIIREKNLEVTLRSIADAVIATDIHGNITCMNPEAERLTGWGFEDAKGNALSTIFRMKNRGSGEPAANLIERVKLGKNIVALSEDSMLITSNGDRYHIHESGAPIYDDSGKVIGVVLVFTDITQEHDLKNQLNGHVKRMQRVIDTSMDAVIVTDERSIVKEWSPAAEAMSGWLYEEISGKPIYEIIVPKEFHEHYLQNMQWLMEGYKGSIRSKRIESRCLHRYGHTFPCEISMVSLQTEDGWVFNAFIRDLTDIKNNENIIKRKDGLLRGVQRAAKLGYWELDLVDDTLDWSSEIFRIFSLDPDTVKPSYELFISKVHPEDRVRVDAAYQESIKNNKPYNIIHRIETDEGTKIVHEKCETIFEDNGKPVRSQGMVQDITERKQAEEDLQQVNMVLDGSPVVLFRWKATDGWPVEFVSENVRQFGYTVEELVSGDISFSSIVHPDDLERIAKEVEEYSSAGVDVFAQEYRIVSPAGEVYLIDDRTVVDRDIDGAIVRYQGTVLDITERGR